MELRLENQVELMDQSLEDRMHRSQRADQVARRNDQRSPRLAMLPQPAQRNGGARKTDGELVEYRGQHARTVSGRPAVWNALVLTHHEPLGGLPPSGPGAMSSGAFLP